MSSPPEVTIDLGQPCIFDEVRIYTTGGDSNWIDYPKFVAVLAGEDGKLFDLIGLAMSKKSPTGAYSSRREVPRTISVKHATVEARFVRVVMQPGGRRLVLDEIEVIRNARRSTPQIPRSGGDRFARGDTNKVVDLIEDRLQVVANISSTVEFAGRSLAGVSPDRLSRTLARLRDLKKELSDEPGLPRRSKLLATRRELGQIRAEIYQGLYKKPYVCLPANPMLVPHEKEMLWPGARQLGVSLRLWQGEYECGAVNVANCSGADLTVRVSVSPLTGPDNAKVASDGIVTVRRAVLVHGSGVGLIADPLVLNKDRPFKLEPGAVAQIWVTVSSLALQAGTYEGALAFTATESSGRMMPVQTVPVNMKVEPIKFKRDAALNTFCWAHPQFLPMTRSILPEAARDLDMHHTNIFWVHGSSMPYPRSVSRAGAIIAKPSYAKFDNLLRINRYARMFIFHLGFRSEARGKGRFGVWMTEAWKRAFSTWLVDFVRHLREKGVGYDRFAIQPFDESLDDNFYQLARLIKSVDPKAKILANSFGKGSSQITRCKNLVDIWCLPERQTISYPSKFAAIKRFGKAMWVYDAKGPGKANHPYSYYRLMPWRAFKRGQTGAGFWVYCEIRPEIRWNDTLQPFGYYAVIYGAKNSPVDTLGEPIIPSRRWEAWREGVEDYQYLHELSIAIESARVRDPAKAAEAQRVLDSQLDYVLSAPRDYDRVYQARDKLTDALLQLQ